VFILFRSLIDRPVFEITSPGCDNFAISKDICGQMSSTVSSAPL
jgi:hypothetical protein